nr:hypothetical protein [Actinomycetota bacterium]
MTDMTNRSAEAGPEAAGIPPIATPLGPVHLGCVVGRAVAGIPDEVRTLPSGASLAQWLWPGHAVARLVWGRIPPFVVPHLREFVNECWGAVWSIRALSLVKSLTVSAVLTALPGDARGGPDTGERLAAVTYETADTKLSIGTHDEYALDGRAYAVLPWARPPVPRAWAEPMAAWCEPTAPTWDIRSGTIKLSPPWEGRASVDVWSQPGIVARLPGLRPGECVDLH